MVGNECIYMVLMLFYVYNSVIVINFWNYLWFNFIFIYLKV